MFEKINTQANKVGNQENNNKNNVNIGDERKLSEQAANITDIFAETDIPPKPDIFKPKQEGINDSLAEADFKSLSLESSGGKGRKVFSLLASIFGLVLLAFGGYFGYQFYRDNFLTNRPQIENEEDESPLSSVENEKAIDEEEKKESNSQPISSEQENSSSPDNKEVSSEIVSKPIDSDMDGLSDEEETELKTNQSVPDTDNDGLSDFEEIKVYKTNPLNSDSDGDGYFDGQEVKSGYNPLGPGRLYEIN